MDAFIIQKYSVNAYAVLGTAQDTEKISGEDRWNPILVKSHSRGGEEYEGRTDTCAKK